MSSASDIIRTRSTGRTGVTLDELAEFIERARKAGAAGAEPVKGVTFTGFSNPPKVKRLEVEVFSGPAGGGA